MTPRQAFIYAALGGWKGDEPNPWICPMEFNDIGAWAKSYLPMSTDLLPEAFEELTQEGLFFEIHHGLFDPPCYYCSFDSDFLREIADGPEHVDFWKDLTDRYDQEHGLKTWRRLGLCAGQGSQGPSDAPWGPCLGASCCWFMDGTERCNHDLRFAKGLKVPCAGCGQEVVREELHKFASGIWLRDSSFARQPLVCRNCISSHDALLRLSRQYSSVDKKRTLQEFERKWSDSELRQ
jgi:hypothetical protein